MLNALYLLDAEAYSLTYPPNVRAGIAERVNVVAPPQTAESVAADPDILQNVQVLLTGRGCPKLNEVVLAAAPNLKAVFFGKGSVKGIVSDAFWSRGITLVGGYAAMAQPVAEYTLSQILFCLRQGWQHALAFKNEKRQMRNFTIPGAYGSTVGVVSLGMVGRRVCELLRPFDLRVIAHDPYAVPGAVEDVELVALDALFARADVVTLHTPLLPQTRGMVTGAHIASMKRDATLINTARGALIQQDEMIAVLQQRPDLFAVLDVTDPEPLPLDSLLFTLPNVIVTPHIAGPLNREYGRMGHCMADELRRYLTGQPLRYQIKQDRVAILA